MPEAVPAADVFESLRQIRGLDLERDVPLRGYNRFGLGGAADLFAETADADALAAAVRACRELGYPFYLLGDGSNLIVADAGFRGLALRYTADRIELRRDEVCAEVGAPLQALVDFTIDRGLSGLHTLERIPGWVGGAVYGNAGAYGHQMDESVVGVRYFDGEAIRETDGAGCRFEYRESVFKKRKDWIILSCRLALPGGDREAMRREAARIREVRDKKFPPTMRCAGSIFKNLYLNDLPPEARAAVPPEAVKGGKVASALFLERVGAKGMREGGIEIAPYHANVIYNAGGGTASELRRLILELKRRVREQFGFNVEEEVQYVG